MTWVVKHGIDPIELRSIHSMLYPSDVTKVSLSIFVSVSWSRELSRTTVGIWVASGLCPMQLWKVSLNPLSDVRAQVKVEAGLVNGSSWRVQVALRAAAWSADSARFVLLS